MITPFGNSLLAHPQSSNVLRSESLLVFAERKSADGTIPQRTWHSGIIWPTSSGDTRWLQRKFHSSWLPATLIFYVRSRIVHFFSGRNVRFEKIVCEELSCLMFECCISLFCELYSSSQASSDCKMWDAELSSPISVQNGLPHGLSECMRMSWLPFLSAVIDVFAISIVFVQEDLNQPIVYVLGSVFFLIYFLLLISLRIQPENKSKITFKVSWCYLPI